MHIDWVEEIAKTKLLVNDLAQCLEASKNFIYLGRGAATDSPHFYLGRLEEHLRLLELRMQPPQYKQQRMKRPAC